MGGCTPTTCQQVVPDIDFLQLSELRNFLRQLTFEVLYQGVACYRAWALLLTFEGVVVKAHLSDTAEVAAAEHIYTHFRACLAACHTTLCQTRSN